MACLSTTIVALWNSALPVNIKRDNDMIVRAREIMINLNTLKEATVNITGLPVLLENHI